MIGVDRVCNGVFLQVISGNWLDLEVIWVPPPSPYFWMCFVLWSSVEWSLLMGVYGKGLHVFWYDCLHRIKKIALDHLLTR